MSDRMPVPAPPPPRSTAEARIDSTAEALIGNQPARPDLDALIGGLDDLADRPVAEHHDRLAEVHEALHAALHAGLPEQSAPR